MIVFNLTYIQATIILGSIVLTNYLFRFLLASLIKSQWWIERQMKKRIAIQKSIKKTKRELWRENLLRVAGVLDEIDKQLGSNQRRKQFWLDFAKDKKARKYWIDELLKQVVPITKKVKTEEKKDEKKKKKRVG